MIICCGQASSLRNSSQADSVLAEAALLRASTDTTGTAHATPSRIGRLLSSLQFYPRTTGERRIQYLYTGRITNCHVQFSNGN